MMWFDQGYYDYKYKHKIEISHHVPISERMIADGTRSLARVLPRESDSRPYDMAQLSLIWPYNIVDFDTKEILLHNIETHLVGERGVRRYPGDVYCGKGLVPGANKTAEWPLGFAWLAICYAKLAEHGHDFDAHHRKIHFDSAQRRPCSVSMADTKRAPRRPAMSVGCRSVRVSMKVSIGALVA